MNRYLLFALALAMGVVSPALAKSPKIVATTTDLASVAKAVTGPDFNVRSITTGKEDPHFLTAKPSFITAARKADLWIRVGMELEIGWEPEVLRASRNAKIRVGQPGHLDASQFVRKLDVPTERVSRAQGDVHPGGNPHYWTDPWNLRLVARAISERLEALYPDQAENFRTNLRQYQQEIDQRMFGETLVQELGAEALWKASVDGRLMEVLKEKGKSARLGGWAKTMAPLQGASIVTQHKSWDYFADRFGMTIAATLEPLPGIPPTPKHLAQVQNIIKEENVPVVIVQPFYSKKAAGKAASGTPARVVVTTSMVGGDPEAKDSFSLMDLTVRRLTTK